MKKRSWLLLALVFVMIFTLALAGCGTTEEPVETDTDEQTDTTDTTDTDTDDEEETTEPEEKLAEEQVIKLNWGAEPPDLDPQTCTDTVGISIMNLVLDGLVRKQLDGSYPEGSGLAESWDLSDDETTYTFHLKDGITWTDGTDITAHDFEYAWKRAIDPATASEYAYMMYHIKNGEPINSGTITDLDEFGVKALDDKTLEVVLERPTPFFLSLTQFVTYLPTSKAAVEKFGDELASDPDKIVYSGPFVISEWQHEQRLVLEKNPNYWDKDSVILERIEGDMITNTNTTVNLFETDELYFSSIPAEMMDKYITTPEYTTAPDAVTWYLQFNLSDPYFSNLNMRKAFSAAVDQRTYIDVVMNDGSLVAEGYTPPGIKGYDGKDFATLRGRVLPDYDLEKAKEYFETALTELGITREQFQEDVTILTGEGTWWSRTGQALQQMWKEAFGVELRIEAVSFAIRLERYNNDDYQFSIAGWGADYDDAMTFMDMYVTGGGNNDPGYASEEYDALIKKAMDSLGKERVDAMIGAEKLLGQDLPIYPLFHTSREFLEKPYVKGLMRNAVGVSTEYKWGYVLEH